MTLAELVNRLESESEGNQLLDIAIWDEIENWPKETNLPNWRTAPNGRPVHESMFAPAYTTSVDSALTLVPEGASKGLSQMDGRGRWNATVTVGSGPFAHFHNGWANSAALALCIAALRARA